MQDFCVPKTAPVCRWHEFHKTLTDSALSLVPLSTLTWTPPWVHLSMYTEIVHLKNRNKLAMHADWMKTAQEDVSALNSFFDESHRGTVPLGYLRGK